MSEKERGPVDSLSARREGLSPEKQARLAELLSGRGSPAPATAIPRRTGSGPVRASFSQRRLWFLDRLTPGSAAYNLPAARLLRGPLDTRALESALGEIVRRHETLRTTFKAVGGEPVLVVRPPTAFHLPIVDLEGRGARPGDDLVRRLVLEESSQPFNLERGPLFRVKLLRLDPKEHVLLVNFHHTIADGWSWSVFARELATLYGSNLDGAAPAALPELPVQFSDYAAWQETWLQGQARQAELEYWRDRLSGELPVLSLEMDRIRPPVLSYRGDVIHHTLPAPLTEGLRSLARQGRATLFAVLLAGFKALLYRHTGRTDIVVGTVVAGRRFPELEGLIGFFVNTLALRTDLGGNPTFLELIGRVRDVSFEADSHQDLPFESLVSELGLARDLSHTPIFQVMFALQNAAMEDLPLPGLEVEAVPVSTGASKFDLLVSAEDYPDKVALSVEYSTDILDEETVRRLIRRYEVLLAGAAASPETRLSSLPMLDAEDVARLDSYNPGRLSYPYTGASLPELIRTQAAESPDAAAVISGDKSLTYRELDARSDRLAAHLAGLGVGLETPVAVSVDRSFGLVVGLLGILKAGAAYVPLDPSYPKERLAFMVEDSRAPVVVATRALVESLPLGDRLVVLLDEEGEVAGGEAPVIEGRSPFVRETVSEAAYTPPRIHPENLAYIMYTSGSTGRPKGVMCTHAGIVDRLAWLQETFRLTPDDRVAQTTPASFDISLLELFWPLAAGAVLVLAKPGGQKDAAYLVRLIREQSITVAQFVPSMLGLLVEEKGFDKCQSLKLMISIGEALPYGTLSRYYARAQGELWNLYGPTETAVHVTAWPCPRQGRPGLVSIGKPLPNVEARIVGPGLEIVPAGYGGELGIAGTGLARGYLGRPDLTAAAFIPDPRPGRPGARLYRTGDLARHLPTGDIDFLGRIDHQVKIRGFRVELGEVEASLRNHHLVKDAVVVPGSDASGEARLVAYLAVDPAGEPPVGELKDLLRRDLPEFMIPSAFVFLEALPLLPNGKIDRKNLPAPDLSRRATGTPYVPPAGGSEASLASIWSGLLGLDRIGAEDNFFELGGHSLMAVQAVARASETFRVEVPLLLMFEHPTIRAMSAAIERLAASGEPASLRPIEPGLGRLPNLDDIENLSEEEVDELLGQLAAGKETP